MRAPARRVQWAIVAAITLAAAALRLIEIGRVPPDPFYDAAVRSMTLSWHNFFFGAFEPGASVSIDKPPVDLWLQVISVKVLGFTSTTLKLPEALAGTAAVPVLYEAVRRLWSPLAGIAAAAALAVLPVEVITARSDTMDGVMMLLCVIALLLTARALETGRTGWLLGAAAALGVAFDVKLLESIVALPALAVLAAIGLPGGVRRRALQLTAAAALYVVVALAWLTATLLVPAHDRPWAIGSTNGSAWNAAFVFNGSDRLSGKSPEPQGTEYKPGHVYPTATQSERDHIPILPPSPTRLLARIGPLSGERLGMEILIGLILGIPALLLGVRGPPGRFEQELQEEEEEDEEEKEEAEPRAADANAPTDALLPAQAAQAAGPTGAAVPAATAAGAGHAQAGGVTTPHAVATVGATPAQDPGAPPPGGETPGSSGRRGLRRPAVAAGPERRLAIRRAAAAGLGVWLLAGLVLFSHMARLHPRYVEGFTPAVAAILGIGIAWACTARDRVRLAFLAAAMIVTAYYAERLLYGTEGVWWVTLAAGVGAVALGALALGTRGRTRAAASAAALTAALVAVLAVGFKADLVAIRDRVSDAGFVGQIAADVEPRLSSYLLAHKDGARYLVAAESATQIGSLIVKDALPVVVLTTYNARVFTPIGKLKRMIAAGEVRYAYLSSFCTSKAANVNAACSKPVVWIRAHGTDVSKQAGLPHHKLLYLLPGARP